MWALFYVIISLKLEKSASHFREQKLRSEVDEIIKEFNGVAERNISMLETRITVLKRLMERGGDIKTVDMVLGDDEWKNSKSEDKTDFPDKESKNEIVTEEPELRLQVREFFKKGLILSFEGIKNKFQTFMEHKNPERTRHENPGIDISKQYSLEKEISHDKHPLEVTVLPPVQADKDGDESWENMESEKELKKLFNECDNRYNLLEDLYRKGYSIETLSRHSGIPAGEVKLVLNLNRSL